MTTKGSDMNEKPKMNLVEAVEAHFVRLEKARQDFDKVGASARQMVDQIDRATAWARAAQESISWAGVTQIAAQVRTFEVAAQSALGPYLAAVGLAAEALRGFDMPDVLRASLLGDEDEQDRSS